MPYNHGVTIEEITSGVRAIQTVSTGIVGVVGTAPDADAAAFPLNTPVLIAGSKAEAAKLDTVGDGEGSLPLSVLFMLEQIGCVIIVVRVEEGVDDAATQANIIGGVNGTTGKYEGLEALKGAASEPTAGRKPKILGAPGFSHVAAVAAKLKAVTDEMRAFAYYDGPNTIDGDATAYVDTVAARRGILVDPFAQVFDVASESDVFMPSSALLMGLRAKVDAQEGFWVATDNHQLNGVTGVARSVDKTRSNLLNEAHVTTIRKKGGFRPWGVRTMEKTDSNWFFEPVVRTFDAIAETLEENHQWAVSRGINATYFDNVAAGVNDYLGTLKALGAIVDGICIPDPDLNTKSNTKLGKAYWNIQYTPVYPAEDVIFRIGLTDEYLDNII